MEFSQRIKVLRNFETECFQICFYLLNNERLATRASKQALINIFNNDECFAGDVNRQKTLLRRFAMRSSLEIYKDILET